MGDARAIPRRKPELASAYALAAKYMGMRLVYLEAGSGADSPVPARMVEMVKKLLEKSPSLLVAESGAVLLQLSL